MLTIKRVIHQEKEKLAKHDFLKWLRNKDQASERRFIFSAIITDFVMSFADINKWFLYYEEDHHQLLKQSINIHTMEDRTHSKIFIEDWYKLGYDDTFDWKPSETIWWCFARQETEVIRTLGMKILRLAVNNPDPGLRFAIIECIEEFGDLLFELTEPIAINLEHQTQIEYRYFGSYHRRKETGRLQGVDETELMAVVLEPDIQRQAASIARDLFRDFDKVFTELLQFSKTDSQSSKNVVTQFQRENPAALESEGSPIRWPAYPVSHTIHSSQTPMVRFLQSRMESLEQHPFLAWLDQTPPSAIKNRFRSFLPLWAIDILTYPDFQHKVLKYFHPRTIEEKTLNRWCHDLSKHAGLFLNDWLALNIDTSFNLTSGETICFLFLSPHTELHRHNMSETKKFALRQQDPILRFWTLYAIEKAGEVFFAHTNPLATMVEQSDNIRLDYLAHRHYLAHPKELVSDTSAESNFFAIAVSPEQQTLIREIIDLVFNNMNQQFHNSLKVGKSEELLLTPAASIPVKKEMVGGSLLFDMKKEKHTESSVTS